MRSVYSIIKCSRGTTLLISMIFLIILGIIEMANIYLKGGEEIAVRAEINSIKCFNLADAGFERMRQWVKNLSPQWPEQNQPQIATTGYNPFGGTIQLGASGETYLTTIQKDTVRSGLYSRYYVIRSSGTAGFYIKSIWATIIISTNTLPVPQLYSLQKYVEEPTKRSN